MNTHVMNKAIESVFIEHCSCCLPAVQLVKLGCFPATPKQAPKWAFDMRLLEHAALHIRYGTPNLSAWCHTTVAFLQWSKVSDVPSYVSNELSCLRGCFLISCVISIGCPVSSLPASNSLLPDCPRISRTLCLKHCAEDAWYCNLINQQGRSTGREEFKCNIWCSYSSRASTISGLCKWGSSEARFQQSFDSAGHWFREGTIKDPRRNNVLWKQIKSEAS